MRQLLSVKAAYDEIDGLLQTKIGDALTKGRPADQKRWEERKELNDYAFYLVLFAQFERIAKEKFIAGRDRRKANPNWLHRRLWDADVFRDADRVGFTTRLAAVLDPTSPEYRLVKRYYEDRNHIAHGGLSNPIASIDVLVKELRLIVSKMRA
jgi:hypothetical protein